MITRFTGLNTLTIEDAGKYFTDRGYIFLGKSTFNQPSMSMDSYSYNIKGNTDWYTLNVIAGQVVSSSINTNNDDEYGQAVKIITDLGFTARASNNPDSGETVYVKDHMDFVVSKKALGNGTTFYAMSLINLLKQRQLSQIKK